jgi:hypothetical protein
MPARRLCVAGLGPALALSACAGTDEADRPEADRSSPSPTTQQSSPTEPGTSATVTATPGEARPAGLKAPVQATSAADLARRLVAAEDVVRDKAAEPHEVAQAAFETQILYRQLARTPEWQERVMARAGRYRAGIADHLVAREGLRSVLTGLSSTLPAWRIIPPTPADDLLRFYRKGERVFGVPWEVLAAVNFVETGFGKIRGYSTAGARGPMQFIPSTWDAYGEGDIDDPHDAIMAAARYLRAAGGDSPAGLNRAIHAYNHHNGYVRGIRSYARILERDPDAFRGLHQWQILYLSARGDIWLPVGYVRKRSMPVAEYIRKHPDRLLSTDTS